MLLALHLLHLWDGSSERWSYIKMTKHSADLVIAAMAQFMKLYRAVFSVESREKYSKLRPKQVNCIRVCCGVQLLWKSRLLIFGQQIWISLHELEATAGTAETEKDGRVSGLDRKQEGKTESQKGCGVHLRLAVITCSVSHHMTGMLNAELGNLTYFHQTDTEIHREAVLRC